MRTRRRDVRPRMARRLRDLAAAGTLAVMPALTIACAGGPRPESALAVTRQDGSVVPLDSTTSEFTVGGVRVIHRANFATDVVAVNLYLLGGSRQLTPDTQGIEALLLRAAEYGTVGYPGARSRAAWGDTGSELLVLADVDWTRYAFRGIRAEFDRSWDVFADRVMRPELAPASVATVRARRLTALAQQRASADGLAFLLADSVAYAGHPYALRPGGTEASLAGLDSAALARYHAAQMVTSRMLLVVVGGIDRGAVEAAVTRSLARLPRGDYAWSLPPAVPAAGDRPAVTFVHRPAATNYVLGIFQGPPAAADDAPAFRLAAALLSGRMHRAVREERGLSYAAYAPYYDRGVTAAGLYMSTAAPGTALGIVRAQLDSTRRENTLAGQMRFFTQQFVTEYIGNNMTSADQADFLARAALYLGDYHAAGRAMDELRHVSAGGVRAAAFRYFTHARFVYVGDTTRVTREAFDGF